MNALSAFHFLRPEAWLLLFPAAAVLASVLRRQRPEQAWRAVIEPGLLRHLVLRRDERGGRLRPVFLIGLGWFLGIFTLAGPSWEREPTPFTEEQAALFLVLRVTPDMLAQDVQPSRLQRAAQKIEDLLEMRPGARAGLIAYAGSAHRVMPLTSDPEIISYFAEELRPGVMPLQADELQGDALLDALEQAGAGLRDSGLPGSIVLLADHVDPGSEAALADWRARYGYDVHILAMAAGPEVIAPPGSPPAPALDEQGMRRVARAGGGALVPVTPDDSDVRRLAARVESSLARAPLQQGERWKDAGYYLLPFFVFVVLLFFRRGGAMALRL